MIVQLVEERVDACMQFVLELGVAVCSCRVMLLCNSIGIREEEERE